MALQFVHEAIIMMIVNVLQHTTEKQSYTLFRHILYVVPNFRKMQSSWTMSLNSMSF